MKMNWDTIIEENRQVDDQDAMTAKEFSEETGLCETRARSKLKELVAGGVLVETKKRIRGVGSGPSHATAWKVVK